MAYWRNRRGWRVAGMLLLILAGSSLPAVGLQYVSLTGTIGPNHFSAAENGGGGQLYSGRYGSTIYNRRSYYLGYPSDASGCAGTSYGGVYGAGAGAAWWPSGASSRYVAASYRPAYYCPHPAAVAGSPYNYQFWSPWNDGPAMVYSVYGAPPAGVVVNPYTGAVYGTSVPAGDFVLQVVSSNRRVFSPAEPLFFTVADNPYF
jgi:hypothetical protein